MGRTKREFKRKGFNRDFKRLFIIATEGEKTEPAYFESLKKLDNILIPYIYFEVFNRGNSKSSPASVLNQLDSFSKEYNLDDSDELWMLIDRDRWTLKMLKDTAAKCGQKNYSLAVSNPCFEFWLLLHLEDVGEYSEEDKKELFENKKIDGHRNKIELKILEKCDSYNKSNPDFTKFLPNINVAIERAEKLNIDKNERWPNGLGTHVYLLVEKLIKS